MDSESNQPDAHMSLSWSWPHRHTAPPARSPWAPCWPLCVGHLATCEQPGLQICVLLTHCDASCSDLVWPLRLLDLCWVCASWPVYACVPLSKRCDRAVCSIHPIGGLIEITVVGAPVNDNVQYNGLWPCSVLWWVCHLASKALWFNEQNAYYFEWSISNEIKSAPIRRELILFLWRYFSSW